MRFAKAEDVKARVVELVEQLRFSHIDSSRIVCFRSKGSKSRAQARIWSLPRIWQKALGIKAHYVLEVLSEKFDSLPSEEKDKILIHELMHIPKTFSGALVPHLCFGKRINKKTVEALYKKLVRQQV